MLSPFPKDVFKERPGPAWGEKIKKTNKQKKKTLGPGGKYGQDMEEAQSRSNPPAGLRCHWQIHRKYSPAGHRKLPLEGAF